jgi:D-tyrosyl-tRNA(Tyr) deacylase
MKVVIQRVKKASVIADGIHSGACGQGLLLLLGVAKGDEALDADLLADKIAKLRIFSDENGKMNRSVLDIGGEVLVVSNFTLLANYAHGNRPDYFDGASPDVANALYEHFVSVLKEKIPHVETGVFGADMQIDAVCDGPVTIWMESEKLRKGKNA